MIEVGECYFNKEKEHFVVISSKNKDKFLIISITSLDYDKSCKLEITDIVDNNGKQILKHTSYMAYKFAYEFEDFKTFEMFRKIYNFKCVVSDVVLKKIYNGAKKSKYLQNKFKKYFID